MKSFRLDPDSVTEFLRSWPVFLAGGLIGSAVVVIGRDHSWVRYFMPLMGICLGPRLFVGQIRDRYPTARHPWLLSIGMMIALVGVTLRMSFPAWQGTAFDLTWLGISFFTILTFVVLNRGNNDIIN